MTDLDFPDLSSAAADATRPPTFDALQRRAERRTTRRTIGAALAVAVTVAALASSAVVARDHTRGVSPVQTPTPTPTSIPTQTPTPTAVTAEQVVGEGSLFAFARSGSHLLTIWQRCADETDGESCRFAWRLSGGRPVVRLLPGADGATVEAADGRFVLSRRDGSAPLVVDADGSTREVVSDDAVRLRTGDALVSAKGDMRLIDPASARQGVLGTPAGVDRWDVATIGGDGTVWAIAAPQGTDVRAISEVGLWHSTDGKTWARRALKVGKPTMPGYVVASGDHVAALATYDGATVLPVGEIAVTSDGGRTWRDLARNVLPFEFVDSMAATSGGTLYVAGGGLKGGVPLSLYRATGDWTHFERVDLPHGVAVGGLQAGGPVVLGQTGFDDPELFSIDDAGLVTRWTDPLR